MSDDVLTFQVELSGDVTGLALEVWAGSADCAPLVQRRAPTASCWLVARTEDPVSTVFSDVRAQNVLGLNTPLPDGQGPTPGTVSDCFASAVAQPLELDFLLVDAAGNVQGKSSFSKDFGFDVNPPSPPGRFTVDAGRGRLRAEWTPSASADVVEYRILCDAPLAPALDSASHCATMDTLTTVCGEATGSETSGIANGLDADRLTTAAAVAVDSVGNVSEPSAIACTTVMPPAPDDDVQTNACFCTLQRAPKSADGCVAGFVALCTALVCRRRWR